MQKLKYFIFFLVASGSLIFLFSPGITPDNLQFRELLNSAPQNDVIIIFNSGGWGDTPLEEAKDFTPIMEGIQRTLGEWGYTSIVIPFARTKEDLLGRIGGAKELFNFFRVSSDDLAEKVENIAKNLPDKKIILTGLSNGASFVDKTYEKISQEAKNSVYAITVGPPFWAESVESDNVLQLNNNGQDSLVEGKALSLFSTFIKAPFRWIFSKINGQNLKLSQALNIYGHKYDWDSPEVNREITSFLASKFR